MSDSTKGNGSIYVAELIAPNPNVLPAKLDWPEDDNYKMPDEFK